jgi:hypothetical protein
MKRIAKDAVERRLADEARSIRAMDGFSTALHEHIMESLRRQGLSGAEAPPSRNPWYWRAAVPLGLAAAVALGAWLILRTPDMRDQPPQAVVETNVPPLPAHMLPGIDTKVTAPTTSALDAGKYAYLDRDAHKLFIFVADQLPDFSEQK